MIMVVVVNQVMVMVVLRWLAAVHCQRYPIWRELILKRE
jgi:hypothetical protein